MTLRINATVQAAIDAAEDHARLAGELATIEANRNAAIAATNAVADTLAAPVIAALDASRAQLETWWRRNADAVTGGKRRSAELGGCMLGLRAGRAKVVFAKGDDAAAVKQLLVGPPFAKALLKVKHSLDRAAIAKALDGRRAAEVRSLGFAIEEGTDAFFIDPVEQLGVATPA